MRPLSTTATNGPVCLVPRSEDLQGQSPSDHPPPRARGAVTVPFDKSAWGTPSEVHSRTFSKAANSETAGSYLPDGRYNLGGWWTYPSPDAVKTDKAPTTASTRPVAV